MIKLRCAKRLLLSAALAFSPCAVIAQSSLRVVPLGYCQSSSLSSAIPLSSFTGMKCTAANLTAATYVVICAYSQGVVYLDDGETPTSTPGSGGVGIAAGQCVPYNGTISALQFIQQAATATIGVSLYR